MKGLLPYTINVGGKLMDLSEPQVMGILNVTPDSFYSASRKNTDQEIAGRVQTILAEGGSMIDIGAYSSRPGADDVSAEEDFSVIHDCVCDFYCRVIGVERSIDFT